MAYQERREREGREIDPAYLDRPELRPEAVWFWNAWHDLAGERVTGMGERPTPYLAIDRYAERVGITDPDEFERFKMVMGSMDGAYFARKKPPADEEGEAETVSVNNVSGLKSFMQRFKKPPMTIIKNRA